MFGTILITICTLIHLYVFWRITTMPLITQYLSARQIAGIGFVLWSILVLSRFYARHQTGTLACILEMAGMNWLGFMFLIFAALLFSEIITGFGFVFSGAAASIRTMALSAGLLLSLVAFIQGTRTPVVEAYEVTIPGLPDQLDGGVVVALSDLHLGSLRGGKWLDGCIEKVKEQHPDLVLLLGDIFEGHGPPDPQTLKSLAKLSPPSGIYAVLGNHEFHGDADGIADAMEAEGIRVLRNRSVKLPSGLVLAGVDDRRRFRHPIPGSKDLLAKTLKSRPEGPTILLSHRPGQIKTATRFKVDLMLSGHTHGGQIWPFDYITRRYFPLLEGAFNIDGMTLIISRGTGTWGPQMRLWAPGEISRITLKKQKREAQ